MRLTEMRSQVREELARIPDWPKPQQSELRMRYWARRMHSLGKKGSSDTGPSQILRECLNDLRRDYPDFVFLYDQTFFQPES